MIRRFAVPFAVAFAALLGSAAPTGAADEEGVVAEVGKPAPEFRADGWIGGDGRTALGDFRGEVVLLWFFRTHCGASRSEVRPLMKLQREEGRRGLAVVALTGDDRADVLRYLTHVDASLTTPVALGSAPAYPARTLPFSALVGADGALLWQGPSGSLPRDTLDAALRRTRKPTAEEQESRAAKALAAAEALLADRQFVRADSLLRTAAERHGATPSGKQAATRLAELAEPADAAVRAEIEAQRDLAKLLGGIERPAEADTRRAQKLAKTLEKRAAEWKESAPRASALAAEWATLCAEARK